eukprot:CAMPEP_0184502654 /NCGR_PEP_ID=MMETSP0113_2-20130426/50911_1 /TAXON_ID=91329 /ORGANISM="Norrisiella sphaerica, Strain BC52" /LENGTH=330 /DNA_ID=CAMNT_0026891925 /DNA_START=327 /DNA_END=1319 /DNA_ORIENTATION=+
MARYRRFEIMADTLYKQRLIRGFCHLYDGQEAIITGLEAACSYNDSIITSYRCHAHQISRGDTPANVYAELLGRQAGCSRGKGGSMHMYYKKNNFWGGNGIVGAQVPLGAGLAFAHKYKGDGGICVTMYGDGAANQGQVFEAANMAALWKLPVVFVCENNQYGMGTSVERHAFNSDFYTRGHYIPGLWIDGMDALAVKKGFEFAKEYVLQGEGRPLFVECQTYRYHGHSMSDPGISYRTREEVQNVRKGRDCIEHMRNLIIEKEWATAEELKAIEKEIRKEIDQAVKDAKASPELPVSHLTDDIYFNEVPPFIRMIDHETSLLAHEDPKV